MISSFWNTRSRNSRSRLPRGAASSCTRASTPTHAPADSRRRTRTRTPGSCPFGCMYHSRRNSTSCSFANCGSTAASGIMWNARSHAAYHGILPLVRHRDHVAIVQVAPVASCAPSRRAAGGGGCAGSPSSQFVDDVVVELLATTAPAYACRATRRSSSVAPSGRMRRVELVRLDACAGRTARRSPGRTRHRAGDFSERQTQAHRDLPARRDLQRGSAPPPWCRCAPASPRAGPRPRSRGTRPSRTAARSAHRTAAPGCVSFSVNSSCRQAAVRPEITRPDASCRATDARRARSTTSRARSSGRGPQPSDVQPQHQVLRNQSVGSRWSARRLRPAVGDGDADQQIVGAGLRVLGEHVEVAVVVEHAGVGELELAVAAPALRVFLHQAPRTETRAADTCRAPSCRSASASSRGSSSTPSRPRRDCPRLPVRPNRRSFRIGSRPFQSASAKHSRHSRSVMPSSPSSPQRYARLRA